MKKWIIGIAALVMLCVMALSLASCSNYNQINSIHVVARDYERLTYTVQWVTKDADGNEVCTDIGTMTQTFRRLNAEGGNPYVINGHKFNVTSGGVIDTAMTITGGDYAGDSMTSTVLFEGAFSPVASYKAYVTPAEEQIVSSHTESRAYTSYIDYVSTKKRATITVNGNTGTFKIPSYCYDNESLYWLVRGSDLGQSAYSLSIAGVNNLQGGTRSVSVAKAASKYKVTVPMIANEVETYLVGLTAASEYGSGISTNIYFLPSYTHTQGGADVDVNKLPVRIDEGNVRYVLSALSTAE